MSRILVVDGEPAVCWGLASLCEGMGHDVRVVASAEQGIELAAEQRPDLLILSVPQAGVDGRSALRVFRPVIGAAPMIAISPYVESKTPLVDVEHRAFESVVQPFDLAQIRAAIERALNSGPATEANVIAEPNGLGHSPGMQLAFRRMALAAASDASVQLSGESGVGKRLAASMIHRRSSRSAGPFVAVNCAALDSVQAEGEFFGHMGSPLNGARQTRQGLLAQANDGTLFLSDVAELSAPIQEKLLRALDQGEALPADGNQPIKTYARVISATRQDLRQCVKLGTFRQDLYCRLCTFEISLPPLCDRREEIRPLANHFAQTLGDGKAVLAEATLTELERRPWLGNVRELRTSVEHALTLARGGTVLPSHLRAPLSTLHGRALVQGDEESLLRKAISQLAEKLLRDPAQHGQVYDQFLEQVERHLLAAALSQSDNQCAPAARILGVHRTTLKRKLERFGDAEGPGHC